MQRNLFSKSSELLLNRRSLKGRESIYGLWDDDFLTSWSYGNFQRISVGLKWERLSSSFQKCMSNLFLAKDRLVFLVQYKGLLQNSMYDDAFVSAKIRLNLFLMESDPYRTVGEVLHPTGTNKWSSWLVRRDGDEGFQLIPLSFPDAGINRRKGPGEECAILLPDKNSWSFFWQRQRFSTWKDDRWNPAKNWLPGWTLVDCSSIRAPGWDILRMAILDAKDQNVWYAIYLTLFSPGSKLFAKSFFGTGLTASYFPTWAISATCRDSAAAMESWS